MSQYGGYEDRAFVAGFYDYHPAHAGRTDVPFYVECAAAAQGPTLELGCGTGRILIPIAEAGCPITGLDLSEHMLARCRAKLAACPADVQERVRLVHGSMVDFDLDEAFALVTVPFRAFSHLVSTAEQIACLQCARRHLQLGGRLILDLFQTLPRRMFDPAYLQESVDFDDVPLPDGRRLRRAHRVVAFHRSQQVNDMEFIYYVTHPGGRVERLVQAFPFRYFFRYEVEHLLARCGFRVVDLFGSHDRSPFTDASPEMLFVAERAEGNPHSPGHGETERG